MRQAETARQTNETNISLALEIDGEGKADIQTDVPFMTHMLDLFTKHGHFNLTVDAKGDTDVDDHHTTEDIGIVLGQMFKEALGDKKGIKRYGSSFVPMDETLATGRGRLKQSPSFGNESGLSKSKGRYL